MISLRHTGAQLNFGTIILNILLRGGLFNAKYYTALDGDFFLSESEEEYIKEE